MIPINWMPASVTPPGSYSIFSFYENVRSLTDRPFRRYKRALDLYERNTGKSHPLASKRGQSNERRSEASIPLANHSNVEWIGLLTIGNPPKLFNCQSLFRVEQRTPDSRN